MYSVSASVWTLSHLFSWPSTTSSHHTSLAGFHGMSVPRRRQTTTFSTVGEESAAASALSFMLTGLPRRVEPSDGTSTFAPPSRRRDATDEARHPAATG